jgi:hypothetical protein
MIDQSTGFPEVPENYFWRVAPSGSYARIQLRKKVLFFSRVVEWDAVERTRLSKKVIIGAADYILDTLHALKTKDEKKFFGSYPPKKLGDAE